MTHCLKRPKRAASASVNHEKLAIVGLAGLGLKRVGCSPSTSCLVTLLKAVLAKMREKLNCDHPGMRPK